MLVETTAWQSWHVFLRHSDSVGLYIDIFANQHSIGLYIDQGYLQNMLQTITKYFINYFTNHCCHHYNVMSKGAMCTLDMIQFNGTITRLCRALERCYVREHSGGGLWTSTLSTTYHSIYSLSVNFISFVIIAIQLNTAAGVHTDSHVIDVCSLVMKKQAGAIRCVKTSLCIDSP